MNINNMNKYLIALDGTGYYSSKTICCKNCLKREYKKDLIKEMNPEYKDLYDNIL